MISTLVATHLRITKENVVRAFDLEIHLVAKEACLHLSQQSALCRM